MSCMVVVNSRVKSCFTSDLTESAKFTAGGVAYGEGAWLLQLKQISQWVTLFQFFSRLH